MKSRFFGMAAVLVLLSAGVASAVPITFSLNDPNAAVSGFPISFGGVVVNLTSATTASILFTANESHPNAITFGGVDAAALNVNALGFSIGPVTELNSLVGFTPTFDSLDALGNVDGLGTFNLRLRNFDGFKDSARTIGFTLTNTSGTWASSSDVLVDNALGNEVAVHAFICEFNAALCTADSGAVVTGFVADGPTGKPTLLCVDPAGCDGGVEGSPVPEPASLVLLGSGLLGLVTARRKVMKVLGGRYERNRGWRN